MVDAEQDDSKLLTITEVCEILRIHRSTWNRRKQSGKSLPPVVIIGAVQRVRRQALEYWLVEKENQK